VNNVVILKVYAFNITFQSTRSYLLRSSDHFSFTLTFIVLHIHSENIGLYTYLKIALSTIFWDAVKETAIGFQIFIRASTYVFIFIYSLRLFFLWADPSPKEL